MYIYFTMLSIDMKTLFMIIRMITNVIIFTIIQFYAAMHNNSIQNLFYLIKQIMNNIIIITFKDFIYEQI